MPPTASSMPALRPNLAELSQGLTLATGRRYKIVVPKLEVDVIQLDAVHFHDGSAVVLPWRWGEGPGRSEREDRISSLSVIAAALRYAKQNPGKKLMLAAHAEASLSHARAQATQALLKGDREAWGKLCVKHQTLHDLQLTLAWVAETHGWRCHPGPLDGTWGPKTRAARHAFRKHYNRARSASLPLDADETSAGDWKAFFDLLDLGLTDELGDDLSAGRSALKFYSPDVLACDPDDGRIDLLFVDPAKPYPDFRAESPPAQSIYATRPLVRRRHLPVDPPVQLAVKLTAIHGLYKPGFTAAGDVDPKACGYQEGYTSDDDLGRIFVNHKPRTHLGRSWQHVVVKDTQFIELVASVELVQGEKIPPDARIEWEWFDPNGPDHPETNQHGARLPDQVDVDGNPRSLLNRGTCDFPKPGSQDMARFGQAGDVGFADGATVNLADTQIADGTSRVRLHVSNVAGDNFVVTARLKNSPRIAPSPPARTGVMTVWKRIDVEYVRMKNALPLPLERVPPLFEPARVQMDFTPERVVRSKRFLTKRDADGPRATAAYASARRGEFRNHGKPGWFFLAAAERLSSENANNGAAPSEPLYEGKAKLQIEMLDGQRWEALVIDGVIGRPDPTVKVRDVADGPWGFAYIAKTRVVDGKTHLYLSGLDYHSDFEVTRGENTGLVGAPGRGGAEDKIDFYYLRHRTRSVSGAWEPGGLGFGEDVFVTVQSAGNVEYGGRSPGVLRAGREYFAGRLLVFTRVHGQAALNVEQTVGVIVHELTHAFGLPHECGYYGWPQPHLHSCAMNVFTNWLYETGTRDLQRFQFGVWGGHLCSKHLSGVREVNLEDNPAMWRWT